MKDKICNFIESLRANPRRQVIFSDEAASKQGIILPVLAMLGWDPFNIDEVKPEYILSSTKVDYALAPTNENRVFIEAKRIQEVLMKLRLKPTSVGIGSRPRIWHERTAGVS
ncbi:MAG: hypothetical protein WCF84_20080 [Anaerolineae bacterium]